MRVIQCSTLVGYGPQEQSINLNIPQLEENDDDSNNTSSSLINGNSTNPQQLQYNLINSDDNIETLTGQSFSSIFSENSNEFINTENVYEAYYNNIKQINKNFIENDKQNCNELQGIEKNLKPNNIEFNSKLTKNLCNNKFTTNNTPTDIGKIETKKILNKGKQFSELNFTSLEKYFLKETHIYSSKLDLNDEFQQRQASSNHDGVATNQIQKHHEYLSEQSNLNEDSDFDDHMEINIKENDSFNETASLYSSESGTSPDVSLMEDEDVFPESPLSSPLSSPEKSNYPRGIINPNYPGFQHLAHTLSEHFLSHQSSDPYDSDLSEYEMELSVDSFDDTIDILSNNNTTNNNNNNILNNNNNNMNNLNNNNNNNNNNNENLEMDNVDNDNAQSIKMSDSNIEDNLNLEKFTEPKIDWDEKTITLPEMKIVPSDVENVSLSIENLQTSDGRKETSSDITKIFDTFDDLDHVSCDLETYLKKYETSADIKVDKNDIQNVYNDDARAACPTPDILIKNHKCNVDRRKSRPENRPDLLRNVSPNLSEQNHYNEVDGNNKPLEKMTDALNEIEENLGRTCVPDNLPVVIDVKCNDMTCAARDDCSLGITPVDIVGDFKREVEREFGLLVSGYKTRLVYRDCSPVAVNSSTCQDMMLMENMTDNALDDGIESNTTVSELNLTLHERDSVPCDLLLDATTNFAELIIDDQLSSESTATLINPEVKKSSEADCRSESAAAATTTTTTATDISKNLISKNSEAIIDTDPIDSNPLGKFIPTAIVKPKYQKSSYDERQLPPIGFGIDYPESKRAWFGINKNINNGLEQSQQQSQRSRRSICFERHSGGGAIGNPKILKTKFGNRCYSIAGSSGVRIGQALVGRGQKEGAPDQSVVAIVTPRKKDKCELHSCEIKMDSSCEKNNNSDNRRSFNGYANANNNQIGKSERPKFMRKHAKDGPSTSSTTIGFDVYNIETALPSIDLEAIETHLKKAKEEEKKRRNDREEIRRRLALGAEDDYFSKLVNTTDRPGRKPSLQSRLQNGKNLQICFMNDASSDTESPSSDSETCPKLSRINRSSTSISQFMKSSNPGNPYTSRPLSVSCDNNNSRRSLASRPASLHLGPPISEDDKECDFFTKQSRLQIEARMALAQAKDMAHMQMEIERQKQRQSPITEVIRNSLEKVGVPLPPQKRRVSRQMLTDMNIAQLQIIVNDLHNQIECLNENLVQFLMERDDLHMGQDSMLVDIEDLTRYLGAKEQSLASDQTNTHNIAHDQNQPPNQRSAINKNQQKSAQPQSKLQRIANLVKK